MFCIFKAFFNLFQINCSLTIKSVIITHKFLHLLYSKTDLVPCQRDAIVTFSPYKTFSSFFSPLSPHLPSSLPLIAAMELELLLSHYCSAFHILKDVFLKSIEQGKKKEKEEKHQLHFVQSLGKKSKMHALVPVLRILRTAISNL